jgi:sphinganine-1-phosphate aldolase
MAEGDDDLTEQVPYEELLPPMPILPRKGLDPSEVMQVLGEIARREDAVWESGKCSGTIYCGDHEHYRLLRDAFGLFLHANALQRDMCPSATRFEREIISMALDLFSASAIQDATPGGLVTTGGTGSILHAMYAWREYWRKKGITAPNVIKPETAHPAFDKACHLLGIDLKVAPVEAATAQVDTDWVESAIDKNTIGIIGSAPNYGYGIIDPIEELSLIAQSKGVFLHVDCCLGGFILPFLRMQGIEVPAFDFSLEGVTSISADTHKYGFAPKGSSVVLFRDKRIRNAQYFYLADWSGGKYCSPGIEGSRSVGLLAATWASMVLTGRDGYAKAAARIYETAQAFASAVASHPELRLFLPTLFVVCFTSDEFNVYHVYDHMKQRGWRFNGQQYPDALHFAITLPQTRPGVADQFAADLGAAVLYAKQNKDKTPLTGAIYGGQPGGLTLEGREFIENVMEELMDSYQEWLTPSPAVERPNSPGEGLPTPSKR